MKKSFVLFLAVLFLGAGCISVRPFTTQGDSMETDDQAVFAEVAWVINEFNGCVTLTVSDQAAAELGYPNGPLDILCVTRETESLLIVTEQKASGVSGKASVLLDNLIVPQAFQSIGNVYYVDLVKVVIEE